jgi:DNA-binding transcriptional LysR family regulator
MDLPGTELRAFVTLADLRHFGRAAERLHVTQPALSKQVRRLEEVVGGPLVVRGYRDVRLTAAGEALLPRARLLLQEATGALDVARRAARGQLGVLRIGFGIASIQKLLPDVLLRFRSSAPGVEVRLRDMSTPGQLAALRRGDLDVAFVRLPVHDPGVVTRPVLRERLTAALGPESPWRARDGLASLAREPWVTIGRSTSASYHDHVIAVCRAAGFTPRIAQETSELFTMLTLVGAGMGVALAPSSAAFRRPPGVRFRTLAMPEADWDIGLAWHVGRAQEPLVRAFVELTLRAYAPARRRRGTEISTTRSAPEAAVDASATRRRSESRSSSAAIRPAGE